MIHDPDGEALDKCVVYVGPYRKKQEDVTHTSLSRRYFGASYTLRRAAVDVPTGPWNSVGEVVAITYQRAGADTRMFRHKFNPSVLLSRSKSFYRIELPDGCVVNHRGYVFP